MAIDLSTDALLSSANPAVNNLGTFMQGYDAARADQTAAMLAAQEAYKGRQGPNPNAAAYLKTAFENAQYPAAFMPQEPTAPKASFTNSVGRGVDQLQQSLYGFAAQVGDMAGSKDLRNWGLLGAYNNEDQINANPRAVPSISNINSMGDFGNWAVETLGEQIPNLGLSLGTAALTGGASLAAGLPAAAARGLGTAGFYGTVMAPESGQAYLTDFEKHGSNTSPWKDLGVGAINAALETAFSVEGGLMRRILGHPVSEAANETAKNTVGSFLRNRAMGGLREGATEGAQELTQMLNERMQDNNFGDMFNKDDVMRILDSVAAGAVLGAPLSVFEGGKRKGAQVTPDTTNVDPTNRTFGQDWVSGVTPSATPEGFATTPDSFLASAPRIAEFSNSLDNNFLDQAQPVVNPAPSALVREAGFAPFEATPDSFLQQQQSVTPYQERAPFQSSMDNGFLNQATASPAGFERTPDQFLQNTASVVPNITTPPTTAEIMSGQAAALGSSRDTALKTVSNNFLPLINNQVETANRAQDQVAMMMANSVARKSEILQRIQTADPIQQRQLNKIMSGLDEQVQQAKDSVVKEQAKLAAMRQQFTDAQERVNKLYDARERKLSGNALTAQETARQQLVTKDANYFTRMQAIADDTKVLGSRIANNIQESLDAARNKVLELRNLADNPRNGLSPDEIRRVRKQLRAAEATQLDLSGKMKKASKLADTLMQRTTDPAKLYNSILEAQTDFDQLRSIGSVAQSVGAESVTSQIEAPVVDKVAELTKTIEQNRAEQARQKAAEQATGETQKAPAQQEATAPKAENAPAQIAQTQSSVQNVTEQPTAPVQQTQTVPTQETGTRQVSPLARRFAEVRAAQTAAQEQARTRPANMQVVSAVSKHITSFTSKFKGLAGKISQVWQAPAEHLNDLGFIDQNGNIVLIASNLENYARTNGISLKDVVTATIQHEGIGHYGLRTVFDNAGLTSFLTNVRDSLSSSPAWKALEASSEAFRNQSPIRQAEEFCSLIAERSINAANLGTPERSAWTKLKSIVKSALTKLGFVSENKLLGKQNANITEKDIVDILTKGAQNLTDAGAQRITDINESMGRSGDITTENTPAARTVRATEESNKTIADKFKHAMDLVMSPDKRSDVRNYWYDRLVDANDPVRRMVDSLKALGYKEDGTSRVNMFNNVFKHLQVLNNKTVIQLDQHRAKYVQPLLEAINKLKQPGEDASIAYAKAADYLEAQHALERNKFARENSKNAGNHPVSGISDELARKTIEQLSSPQMDEVSRKMQELNEARLRMIEEYKLIPNAKEVVNNWRQAYQYYVPFKGWEDVVKVLDPSWYKSDTRKNISTPSAQKTITKRAIGREGEAHNPVAHGIMQMYDVVYLANKTEAGRSLLQLARDNADASDILELVKTKKTDPEEAFGLRPRVDSKTGEITWINNTHSAVGEMVNTVAVIDEQGNMQRVLVKDENAARAMRGENILQSHPIIKAIGNIQSVMARYVTALNPLFWLRNPFRDTVTAALNMKSVENELRNLGIPSSKDIAKSLMFKGLMGSFSKNSVRQALFDYYRTHDMSFSKFSPEIQRYMGDLNKFLEYGGQTEYFTQTSYNAIQKDIVSALRDLSPNGRLQKGQALARNMVEYMSHISDSLENMTRYIAFKEMVDAIKANNKQLSPGLWQRADGRLLHENEIYSRAANVALNLTVNFGMKGSWAPVINSLYMFASASIAGNARMLETIMRKNPATGKLDVPNFAKFMMVPVVAYAAQAMLCRALMPDDDDGINKYDKIPDYEKNSNMIIPGPDGSHITVPLPFGYNFLWTAARNMIDVAYGKANGVSGPSVTKAAWSTLMSAFDTFNATGQHEEGLNMFIPSVVRPFWQLAENKNFAGNPIKPEGNEYVKGEVPEHQKYWSTQNESVVKLCKGLYQATGLDVSPETLEHLVTSYTGGLGKIFTQTLARVDDWQRGKPLDIGRLPGVNVFVKTPQDSDTSAVFSKLRTQVLTQNTAAEEAKMDRTLPMEERLRIQKENAAGTKLKSSLDSIQNTLNNLRQQERALDKQDISNDVKQQRLEAIKAAKTRTMMRFNKLAISAGITDIQ
jgi:hypothetical protein